MIKVTPTSPSLSGTGWIDVDVSGSVSANATGVIVDVECAGTNRTIGFRKKGSTDDRKNRLFSNSQMSACIGVDSNGIFQLYRNATDVTVILKAYFEGDAVFKTNADDISLGSTGAFTDVDISTETGGDTAIAAIVEVYNTSADTSVGACYLRKNGSTDDYTANAMGAITYHIVGVDGSEIFEGEIPSTTVDFYLVGYIVSDGAWNTNVVDNSVASTGAYADMTALNDSLSIGAWFDIERVAAGAGVEFQIREKGDANDLYDKTNARNFGFFSGCDGSQICEGKIANTNTDFFEKGYFYTPSSGARRIFITGSF